MNTFFSFTIILFAVISGLCGLRGDSIYDVSNEIEHTEYFMETKEIQNIETPTDPVELVHFMVDNCPYKYVDDLLDLDVDPLMVDYIVDVEEKRINLYNDKYFDVLFGASEYTPNDLFELIQSKKDIDKEYLDFIVDYMDHIYKAYGYDIDTRLFCLNLKRLVIKNVSKEDFENNNTIASFDAEDSSISFGKLLDLNYWIDEHTFRHELGHMFTDYSVKIDGYTISYSFKDGFQGHYLVEGINNYFMLQPFMDEYPENINGSGYPAITRFADMLIVCMDYTFSDFITDNIYKFENRLSDSFDFVNVPYFEDLLELQYLQSMKRLENPLDRFYYDEMYYDLAKMYIIKNRIKNLPKSEKDAQLEYIRNKMNPDGLTDDYEGIDGMEKAIKEATELEVIKID